MAFQGPDIYQTNNTNKSTPKEEHLLVFILASGKNPPFGLNTLRSYIQLEDVENDNITPSYDSNEDIWCHYHISEYFRLNPKGILNVLFQDVPFFLGGPGLPLSILKSNIKGIGVVFNSPLQSDTIEDFVGDCQNYIDDLKEDEKILIDYLLLEGTSDVTTTKINDYTDLSTFTSPVVSVVIGKDISPILDDLYGVTISSAAVGSALGMLGVRRIEENLGSVNVQDKPRNKRGENSFPLTDKNRGLWLNSALYEGVVVSDLTISEKTTLESKGYLFVGKYPDFDGLYFNDSRTCIEISNAYSRIENNRIWNHASRELRKVLTPRMNSILTVDPTTGKLNGETIKALEVYGKKVLEDMAIKGQISGGLFFIDPDQIPDETTPLIVSAQYVQNKILHEIEIGLGPVNTI